MSWRNWSTVVGIWGLIAGAGIVSYAGATSLGTKSYDPTIMASWVQAIGSIGAILGAVWVAKHQQRVEMTKRRDAIFAVATAAVLRTDEIAKHLEHKDPQSAMALHFHRSITDSVISAMNSVPLHDIGTPNAILAFASMRDQIGFLTCSVEQLVAGPWRHEELGKHLERAKRDFADDPETFLELVRQANRNLANNVQVHVRAIHQEFDVIEREMTRRH